EVSVDVHFGLTFGYNATDGFFIDTSAVNEVSLSNITVTGKLAGEGQFGFLTVELQNATLNVNGVTVGIDLVAPTGTKLGISDLANPAVLDSLAHVVVTG